jgi:hypothetical protein
MTRKVRLLTPLLPLPAAALAGLLLGGPARAEGENEACTTTSFKVKQVEDACKKGGRKEAKALMQKVVKDQKAKGNEINCKTCHSDLKSFALKDNAVGDLKPYLGG